MSHSGKPSHFLITVIAALSVLLAVLTVFAVFILPGLTPDVPTEPSESTSLFESTGATETTEQTEPSETTVPTEPPIVKESTAVIGATGDILLHQQVINSGYQNDKDIYDYTYIFENLARYVGALDYAVANMEGTLSGNEGDYEYSGYPNFNAPDAIAEAAKNAGFDMLLTANNHSYDKRAHGFHRTQQVISDLGLDHIGTKMSLDVKDYIVKEINGIKIGMSCYTYDTRTWTEDRLSLNGIPLNDDDALLINSFNEAYLEEFYEKLSGEMADMKSEGADVIMLFIHWGDEYFTSPNSTQKKIAQALCDLGVDVIVGGHPHVMQPIELLTGTEDATQHTLCLYSMGNAVSNITHRDKSPTTGEPRPYECEDGLLFNVTFAKYSDGTVIVESADVVPYYVNRYYHSDLERNMFPIVPLVLPEDEWQSTYGLTDEMFANCKKSLSRTNAIIGEGLAAANDFFSQQQAQIEADLGVVQN